MDYRDICEKVMTSDKNVKDVFIISGEARLTAFSGGGELDRISEAQFAEILEDLLFMIGSRKHHENVFGRLEYIHIKHNKSETFAFPFERDKVLCVCMKGPQFNEKEIINKLKHSVHSYPVI